MAHERFLGPGEMMRINNPWPPQEFAGKTYYFLGNVTRTSKEHRKYQALKAGGGEFLIRENAVDVMGQPVPGMLAIYSTTQNRDSRDLTSRPHRRSVPARGKTYK